MAGDSNTAPGLHSEQLCVCSGNLQVPGIHNLPGPKVDDQHRQRQKKGPAEDVRPASAQEVQPASGAADPISHRYYVVCSLCVSHCRVWIGHQTGQEQTTAVRTAERIISEDLPSTQDLNMSRVRKRGGNIIADPSHPGHNLFQLLPSGRHYRALYAKTTISSHRLLNQS